MVKTSPGRPVDVNKDRDILAAGRTLLFEYGPQAVTMEAIARTAGVAKPTLYRRNANGDELQGMLMGMDLVRTLYHVPMPRDVPALDAHVQTTVDDFLTLHRRG